MPSILTLGPTLTTMSPLSTSFFLLFFLLSPPLCVPARTTPTVTPEAATVKTVQNYNDRWHVFKRFLDARRGNRVNGISELKRYFHRFGYLPGQDSNFTDVFDAGFESALTTYQAKLGLPVSRKLDYETISQIMAPRCGTPDVVQPMRATRHYVYFPGRPRWDRSVPMRLTYAFSPVYVISYLSVQEIRDVFKRAFARWASVIPVSFAETDDYSYADIKIGFYSGDHGDGQPFDGVLGVLAHSFSPESGRFHLDAAETWSVDFESEKSKVAVDLESVATHEIGHVLGLAHTPVREAVMYPTLKPRIRKVDMALDDIQGVQALYGSNPNFKFGSLLESETSSNQAADLRIRSFKWGTTLWLALIVCLCT